MCKVLMESVVLQQPAWPQRAALPCTVVIMSARKLGTRSRKRRRSTRPNVTNDALTIRRIPKRELLLEPVPCSSRARIGH